MSLRSIGVKVLSTIIVAVIVGASFEATACCQECGAPVGTIRQFRSKSNTDIQEKFRHIYLHTALLLQRVEAISELFLGVLYKLGPLGEGPNGEFDRDPLIRFDLFDCTTFVETVMALSLERDVDAAARTLQKIRYKNGQIGYATRNHFTELDWVPNNIRSGYLRDITSEVAGDYAIEISKTVSKREWYQLKSMNSFKAPFSALASQAARLGEQFPDERATLTVLPTDSLPDALHRIPSGTIANFIRAEQRGKETIVSHQAFLIKKSDGWYVRHAASGRTVEDDPIADIFARYNDATWPLIGLNLNVLRDPSSAEAPP
jgi:N-acetylmuramoyl-L-alanine amidase-like protein